MEPVDSSVAAISVERARSTQADASAELIAAVPLKLVHAALKAILKMKKKTHF